MTCEYSEPDNEILLYESAHTAAGSLYYLPELPKSPFRSLGGRLDYAKWTDREQFLELDAAILLRQELELVRNAPRHSETEQVPQPDDFSRFSD